MMSQSENQRKLVISFIPMSIFIFEPISSSSAQSVKLSEALPKLDETGPILRCSKYIYTVYANQSPGLQTRS